MELDDVARRLDDASAEVSAAGTRLSAASPSHARLRWRRDAGRSAISAVPSMLRPVPRCRPGPTRGTRSVPRWPISRRRCAVPPPPTVTIESTRGRVGEHRRRRLMDLLDRVMVPAADLLGHVDDLLTSHGAPPEHPVWALMRRVGALPGGALAQVAALDAERHPGRRAARSPHRPPTCRPRWPTCRRPSPATGVAATAYASRWADVSGQIADDHDGLAGRVTATASYLHDVADWESTTRHDARGRGWRAVSGRPRRSRCAPRSGAISVPAAILAAADIAAHVLESVAPSDRGWLGGAPAVGRDRGCECRCGPRLR